MIISADGVLASCVCQHHLKAFDQGLQEGEAVKVYSYGDGG